MIMLQFRVGPVPDNPDFDPIAEGWQRIREPGPVLVQIIGLPVGLLVCASLVGLLYLLWPGGSPTLSTWLTLVLLGGMIPAHELIHALTYPGGLSSSQTIIGLWPSRVVAYAHYEGETSRNRLLLVFITPFVGLSLLPIILLATVGWPSFELALLAILNGAASAGDLMSLFIIGQQIPSRAVVRNKGWRTYWRE